MLIVLDRIVDAERLPAGVVDEALDERGDRLAVADGVDDRDSLRIAKVVRRRDRASEGDPSRGRCCRDRQGREREKKPAHRDRSILTKTCSLLAPSMAELPNTSSTSRSRCSR